jgi:hypothetical protein
MDSWLTFLSKCSKWRLSKKRGLVADGCRILNEFALRNVSAHACVSQVYAPQTKVLEGLTKDEIQVFDILFNGLEGGTKDEIRILGYEPLKRQSVENQRRFWKD